MFGKGRIKLRERQEGLHCRSFQGYYVKVEGRQCGGIEQEGPQR